MSKPPRRFEEFRRRADALVESPGRLERLSRQAAGKLSAAGGGKFREMRDQLTLGIALVRAWLSGDYREVSRTTIVAVAAALLYFVVPLDVIPDFLLGWGFIDDAAVLAYVFSHLKNEVEAFRTFLEANEDVGEVSGRQHGKQQGKQQGKEETDHDQQDR